MPLVLIGGRSLVTGQAAARDACRNCWRRWRGARSGVYDELRAQVRAHPGGGHPADAPRYPQAHAPGAAGAGGRGAAGRGVRNSLGAAAVRFSAERAAAAPFRALKRLTSAALGLLRGRFHTVLARRGCRTTDHFAGFQITGRFRTAELVELLAALPEGSTELMCHPGRCGEALRNARTRLKESRERELEALCAPEIRAALRGMPSNW